MPNLQQHQLRVAAVALKLCQAHLEVGGSCDLQSVVEACLLHDMGNIIKSDLSIFPDFIQPEGLEYWQQKKVAFLAKWGAIEHHATLAIAQELGVEPTTYALLEQIGFSKVQATAKSSSVDRKICAYADMRVAPHGIVSLEDRFADMEVRYGSKYSSVEDRERREVYKSALREIERQLFADIKLEPFDLTDQTLSGTINSLGKQNIRCSNVAL